MTLVKMRKWQEGWPQRCSGSPTTMVDGHPVTISLVQFIGFRDDGQVFYSNVDGEGEDAEKEALATLESFLDYRCQCPDEDCPVAHAVAQ